MTTSHETLQGNTSTPPLIDLHDVIKVYSTAAGDFTALKGINARVDKGEFLGIIGKSGAGKSTLLNMITGVDRPSEGKIIATGREVHRMSENQLAGWRGENVGIIFQFFQMLPALSLLQNVILPMDFARKYTPKERRERAMHLLESVELADQAHKLPSMVSGGRPGGSWNAATASAVSPVRASSASRTRPENASAPGGAASCSHNQSTSPSPSSRAARSPIKDCPTPSHTANARLSGA